MQLRKETWVYLIKEYIHLWRDGEGHKEERTLYTTLTAEQQLFPPLNSALTNKDKALTPQWRSDSKELGNPKLSLVFTPSFPFLDILIISPPFLSPSVSSQFLCSAATRALLIVLQRLPVQHCCPLIGAPRCYTLGAISQSADFTFLCVKCFMEESHWLLQHKIWQLCYIPYQHHHLLHQCCAAQCEWILRAGVKCCQSNLDQTQFSGLNISCKSVLFLKIWKSRFWSALASALLQRTACTAWELGRRVPERLPGVDYGTREGQRTA